MPKQALKRKYSQLLSSKNAFEKIYRDLASMPQRDAEDILEIIRKGAAPEAALQQFARVRELTHRLESNTLIADKVIGDRSLETLTLEKLVYYLRSVPNHIAQAALAKVRDATDPNSALSYLRGEAMDYRLSEQETVFCISPFMQSMLDFELMSQNPTLCSTLDPLLDA